MNSAPMAPIHAGVVIYPPFVKECALVNCLHAGFNPDIFQVVSYIAGRTVKFHQRWHYSGVANTSKGLEWQGIVGSILNGELDASANLLFLDNPNEAQVIDYSHPVTEATRGFVVRKQYTTDSSPIFTLEWFTNPFNPYTRLVWICMLLLIFAFMSTKLIAYFCGFPTRIWLSLQFYKAVAVFFLYRGYKSQYLATSVDINDWKPPFNDLHGFIDLFENGDVRIVERGDGDFFKFKSYVDSSAKYSRIIDAYEWNAPIEMPANMSVDALYSRMVRHPEYVLVTSYAEFLKGAKDKCELTFIAIEGEVRQLAFGFSKGSKFRHQFNAALHTFQYSGADFYDKIRSKYLPTYRTCDEYGWNIGKSKAVALKTFAAALSIFIGLTICVIIGFFIELRIWRINMVTS